MKKATRVYNRCRVCGRRHGYLRKFGLCRICLRELALQGQIPMFRDKGPIEWHRDSPRLIMRKLARQLASSGAAVATMNRLVALLEQRRPTSQMLHLLYRWIISASIYKGFREGLRNLGARQQ